MCRLLVLVRTEAQRSIESERIETHHCNPFVILLQISLFKSIKMRGGKKSYKAEERGADRRKTSTLDIQKLDTFP